MDSRGILSLKGELMPGKRMIIKLSQNEQSMLETYVSQGQKNARAIHRARILLLSNEGRKSKEIARVLGVSWTTISNVRKKYHTQEHDHLLDFLQDAPRSGRPITLDSTVEANVSMIACSAPPAGCARWTLHLIADKLVELDVIDTISHESVRSLLKKTHSSHG
jgi:transposase